MYNIVGDDMNYDFSLNKENLLDCLKKNKLDRNIKLNNLLKLINILDKNTIISIDGNWGCGKTIFVKQLELINKIFYEENKNLGNESSLDENIIEEFNNNHIVYYYNAWENDNHIEPIKSIIYKIINDFPKEKAQTIDGNIQIPLNFKEFLKSISSNLIDIDKVESFKDLVANIYTVEEQKKALNNLLNSICPDDKKLVIIVDELDRCNPKFAVDIIETIKHFFDNDKLIFIVVSNNEQLSHTFSKFYGEKFDGYGYLNKIYDLIISLENIDPSKYIKDILNKYMNSDFDNIMILSLCEYYNLSMREINRYIYMIDLLEKYYNNYDSLREKALLKFVFIPYCLALKIKNVKIFNEFTGGRNIEDFILIMNSKKEIADVVSEIISRDSSYNKSDIKCDEYVREIYNVYFNNQKSQDYFKQQNKKAFLDAISLISNFSNL